MLGVRAVLYTYYTYYKKEFNESYAKMQEFFWNKTNRLAVLSNESNCIYLKESTTDNS